MKYRYQPLVLDVGFLFPFLGFVVTKTNWHDDERLASILSEDVGPDATTRSRTVLLLSRLIRQRAVLSSGSDKQISQKDFRDEIVAELASGDKEVSTTIDLSSFSRFLRGKWFFGATAQKADDLLF